MHNVLKDKIDITAVQVIWTKYLSSDFPLFIALAILLRERDHLVSPKHDFSDILQVTPLCKQLIIDTTATIHRFLLLDFMNIENWEWARQRKI